LGVVLLGLVEHGLELLFVGERRDVAVGEGDVDAGVPSGVVFVDGRR
jgi:hypothetical protein